MATEDYELTIDELARRTGMTVRNIRAHQSRGLLSPPEVRGRTGFYGPEHVARIEVIREMQAEGYNLELIRRLLDGAHGASDQVLRFTRALREPFADETPEIVDAIELAERMGAGENPDPELLKRAIELGLLRPVGDNQFEEMSPRLMAAGEELARLGVPASEAIEVVAKLRRNADSVSKMFVELFLEAVWRPFEDEGRPDDRWPEVADALERLRPLASEALQAVFALAMDDAVERQFGREMEREPRRASKRSRRR